MTQFSTFFSHLLCFSLCVWFVSIRHIFFVWISYGLVDTLEELPFVFAYTLQGLSMWIWLILSKGCHMCLLIPLKGRSCGFGWCRGRVSIYSCFRMFILLMSLVHHNNIFVCKIITWHMKGNLFSFKSTLRQSKWLGWSLRGSSLITRKQSFFS